MSILCVCFSSVTSPTQRVPCGHVYSSFADKRRVCHVNTLSHGLGRVLQTAQGLVQMFVTFEHKHSVPYRLEVGCLRMLFKIICARIRGSSSISFINALPGETN